MLIHIWNTSPTFYVAFISSIVAWLAYLQAKRQSVYKNTLDFQTHWNDSERVDEAWSIVYEMSNEKNNRMSISSSAELINSLSTEALAVREILNRLECTAAAVSNCIYDETMLRKNYSGPWLRLWGKVYEDYVCKSRTLNDNPRIYEQLETMFVRWQLLRDKEDVYLKKNGKKEKWRKA